MTAYVTRGGVYCAASQCSSCSLANPELSFHKFPKDPQKCHEWLRQVDRPELYRKTPEQLNRSAKLCSRHFTQDMFMRLGYNRLKWNAVPTIFSSKKTASSLGLAPADSGDVNQQLYLGSLLVKVIRKTPQELSEIFQTQNAKTFSLDLVNKQHTNESIIKSVTSAGSTVKRSKINCDRPLSPAAKGLHRNGNEKVITLSEEDTEKHADSRFMKSVPWTSSERKLTETECDKLFRVSSKRSCSSKVDEDTTTSAEGGEKISRNKFVKLEPRTYSEGKLIGKCEKHAYRSYRGKNGQAAISEQNDERFTASSVVKLEPETILEEYQNETYEEHKSIRSYSGNNSQTILSRESTNNFLVSNAIKVEPGIISDGERNEIDEKHGAKRLHNRNNGQTTIPKGKDTENVLASNSVKLEPGTISEINESLCEDFVSKKNCGNDEQTKCSTEESSKTCTFSKVMKVPPGRSPERELIEAVCGRQFKLTGLTDNNGKLMCKIDITFFQT